ncbi:hypothetical protein Taro_026059 [Colocasia esculenta]|uniref:Protein kinase domain-containing protein n=1 Tax=Colocasia esculenta TaxID=4460 RepID=A0A843VAY6_COLES|nr:hypothetical protein [Colocasia esculenta]
MGPLFYVMHRLRLLRTPVNKKLAGLDISSHGGYAYADHDHEEDRRPRRLDLKIIKWSTNESKIKKPWGRSRWTLTKEHSSLAVPAYFLTSPSTMTTEQSSQKISNPLYVNAQMDMVTPPQAPFLAKLIFAEGLWWWKRRPPQALYVHAQTDMATFCFVLCFLLTAMPAATSDVQLKALTAFRDSIEEDPLGVLAGWTAAAHHCGWSGVSCDPSNASVLSIELPMKRLGGTISPFLGNISTLRHLNLSSNSFHGNLPSQLGLCSQLVHVDVNDNHLTGEIPGELGNLKKLQSLELESNFFEGIIPSSICNCASLIYLGLGTNNLTGNIPSDIGNLVNLQTFSADKNKLFGRIPTSLWKLRGLEILELSKNSLSGIISSEIGNFSKLSVLQLLDNQFYGAIPPELGNCRNLTTLSLYRNGFTGSIPQELGELKKLVSLWLYRNNLSSAIPATLSHCRSLINLDLSDNGLSGSIPAELASLRSLELLSLFRNRLTGEIPSSLLNMTSLTPLYLNYNYLTGSLPPSLGSLYKLKELRVDGNTLHGPLPSSLNNCTHLTIASFSFNEFSGEIPVGWGRLQNLKILQLISNRLSGGVPDDLFNCTELVWIQLGGNNFSGMLNPRIGKLTNLRDLNLQDNMLFGQIPPEIGNLTSLQSLSLPANKFSGKIPSEISKLRFLQGLFLQRNSLEGVIPIQLFEMRQLSLLQLDHNRLTGSIPDAISGLRMLFDLRLHNNQFNGSIPDGIKDLENLLVLDLSHNKLTGPIHGSLIANMRSLQKYLDLSNNMLEGSLPWELGRLQMVQAIDISNNNLSGRIPDSLGQCINLLLLDLSANMLSGELPANIFPRLKFLVSLNLSSNKLAGELLMDFGVVKQLTSLDLSLNAFDGAVPKSLENLTSLAYLNLSFNQFEGPVPEGGIFKSLNSSCLQGNPRLCGAKVYVPCTNRRQHKHSKKTLLVVALSSSLLGVFSLLVLAIIVTKKCQIGICQEDCKRDLEAETIPVQGLKRFTKRDLEIATSFFSEDNVIGTSNLSTVYRGSLEDGGRKIAVKKLSLHQFPSESNKCFFRELKTLGVLKHRNLVKVLGYAWEPDRLKALVLELMENGSLENAIHDTAFDRSRWKGVFERLRVCTSIANGLVYIHTGYDSPIVHCDLKPSNILFDQEWEAHVSDFGAARMLGVCASYGSDSSTTSAFQGTIGYMAPDLAYITKVTSKVDVFSFGVVVMEFLTRTRPTAAVGKGGHPLPLPELVAEALAGGVDGALHVLDPHLELTSPGDVQIAVRLLQVAATCTQAEADCRPDMSDVLSSLLKLIEGEE